MSSNRLRTPKETRTIDAAVRATAPGEFVQLQDGWVHFELAGGPAERTVVLVRDVLPGYPEGHRDR